MKERHLGEKLVKVFAGSTWEAEVTKGLLESNNIVCMVKDESIGLVTSPYAELGGKIYVLVNEEDEAKAKQIIAQAQEVASKDDSEE
jgi:hypothetical protein